MLKQLLLSASGLLLIGACSTKDDFKAPDGGGNTGEPCGGHGQPMCENQEDQEYRNHWGGEIRLEFIETNTGAQQIILYAWFMSQQDPEFFLIPGSGCTNTLSYTNTTNTGAAINDTRTFMDVGDTITLTGGAQSISISKYENLADKRGLVMDINYAKDGAVRNTVAPTAMLRGAEYDIWMSGMGAFPGHLKLPTQWETIGGTLQFGPNVVNNIPKDTDISWEYSHIPGEDHVNVASLLFVGNQPDGTRQAWFCVAEPDGRLEIPASVAAQFAPSGNLQAAIIAHQTINFNGRSVDVLGITCRQTPYNIQ